MRFSAYTNNMSLAQTWGRLMYRVLQFRLNFEEGFPQPSLPPLPFPFGIKIHIPLIRVPTVIGFVPSHRTHTSETECVFPSLWRNGLPSCGSM